MPGKLVADMTPEEHEAVLMKQRLGRANNKELNKEYQTKGKEANPNYTREYRKKRYHAMSVEEKNAFNKKASAATIARRKRDDRVRLGYNAYMKAYQQRPEVREKRIKKQKEMYAKKVAEKKVQCDVD